MSGAGVGRDWVRGAQVLSAALAVASFFLALSKNAQVDCLKPTRLSLHPYSVARQATRHKPGRSRERRLRGQSGFPPFFLLWIVCIYRWYGRGWLPHFLCTTSYANVLGVRFMAAAEKLNGGN